MTIAPKFLAVALLLPAAAQAQKAYNWTPTQPYADAEHGVSFRVPPTWKPTAGSQTMFGPVLLEATDPKPTAVFYDPPAPGHYDHTNLTGLYFTYAQKAVPDPAACRSLASRLSEGEDTKPHPITLNGITFTVRAIGSAGLGSGAGGHLYNTYRDGTCYLFETTMANTNGEAQETGHMLSPTAWHQIDAHLTDIMRTVRFSTTTASRILPNPPPLETFHEAEGGVTFQYPAVWNVVREAESYSPPFLSAKSKVTTRPVVMVQFSQLGPYVKSNLEGLIFSYYRIKMKDAQACKDFGEVADLDAKPSRPETIHGVTYAVSQGGEGSAGHGIDATTHVTYRDGTCYAFEADFDTAQYTERARDLTQAEMRALQHHLDAVMQTVSFDAPVSSGPSVALSSPRP